MGDLGAIDIQTVQWGNRTIVRVESKRLRECMDYYLAHNMDGICISPSHGYDSKDLSFLFDFPKVQGIVIQDGARLDISAIKILESVQFIAITGNRQELDFNGFPNLEEVRIEWHPQLHFPRDGNAIKRLYFHHFIPSSHSLTDLPNVTNLEELEIVQSSITSLTGVERFKALRKLQLSYLVKLEDIGGLRSDSLEVLHFQVCRKIHNHERAQALQNLQVLCFNDCGSMKSIAFIKKMPRLKEFRFVNTTVEDGDISPCLRMDSVGFLRKKRYSHTPKEVNRIITQNKK